MTDDDLCALETEKRERNISALDRWRFIQDAIAFADAQQPRSRNHPLSCMEHERVLLESLRGHQD